MYKVHPVAKSDGLLFFYKRTLPEAAVARGLRWAGEGESTGKGRKRKKEGVKSLKESGKVCGEGRAIEVRERSCCPQGQWYNSSRRV